jgi:hypothetical protein
MSKIRVPKVDEYQLYNIVQEHRQLMSEMRELSRELQQCAEKIQREPFRSHEKRSKAG